MRKEAALSGGLGSAALLQAIEVIGRALRVRRRAEDRALVVLKHFQPPLDVGCVIFRRLERKLEVCGDESAFQLGDELLKGIAFIAPLLASKVAIKPR